MEGRVPRCRGQPDRIVECIVVIDQQRLTGERDALIVAHGTIGSVPAVVAAFNYADC